MTLNQLELLMLLRPPRNATRWRLLSIAVGALMATVGWKLVAMSGVKGSD